MWQGTNEEIGPCVYRLITEKRANHVFWEELKKEGWSVGSFENIPLCPRLIWGAVMYNEETNILSCSNSSPGVSDTTCSWLQLLGEAADGKRKVHPWFKLWKARTGWDSKRKHVCICRRGASGLRKLLPVEVWSQGFWSWNSGAKKASLGGRQVARCRWPMHWVRCRRSTRTRWITVPR